MKLSAREVLSPNLTMLLNITYEIKDPIGCAALLSLDCNYIIIFILFQTIYLNYNIKNVLHWFHIILIFTYYFVPSLSIQKKVSAEPILIW